MRLKRNIVHKQDSNIQIPIINPIIQQHDNNNSIPPPSTTIPSISEKEEFRFIQRGLYSQYVFYLKDFRKKYTTPLNNNNDKNRKTLIDIFNPRIIYKTHYNEGIPIENFYELRYKAYKTIYEIPFLDKIKKDREK